ncbi:MAG: HAMP domain-containing sensor histidine kinase [Candidatus Thorarchaeota archaeon]|nr:HAMP domain-containing sensor histidine kinase [Candidatus Thorarchaeota archaeon]
MQYVPIEAFLEISAIFAGVIFAVIALIGVYVYSSDIQYRRWAFSHLAFWTAFLPISIFSSVPYVGEFISLLLKAIGSLILLRAFNYPRLSQVPNKILHPGMLLILILYWTPVVVLTLPTVTGAIICSTAMAFAFGFAAKEILTNTHDRSKLWLSVGVSYLLWSISSIPMILLPFIPEIVFFGYLQFIGQSLVLITMYLSFIGGVTRTTEKSMKLTETTSSIIAHDLRNYLNVASSALNLAEGLNDESIKMIETARTALQDASIFIQRTRSMLMEISTSTPSAIDLDLAILVKEAAFQAQKEHSLENTQIEINNCEQCYVSTSPLMKQVIWNIIDNSIRYSEQSPSLTIDLIRNGKIVLSISDHSGGISDSLKDLVMDQGTGENGLGLGLMLVREISHMCGVPVKIEDVVEQGNVIGTVYYLTFSLAGGIPSN